MSDPYVGQIEMFAFGFAPKGWAICAGQTLPIAQNQVLFALLGTTFGGNGTSTFNLPDLRGRLPMGQGNGQGLSPRTVGQMGGEATHTLLLNETPAHQHTLAAAAHADTATNTDAPGPTVVLATTTGKQKGKSMPVTIYATDTAPNQALAPAAIGTNNGGQPHNNMMPYLTLNFCIALQGIFPSRP
ncbi:MAG: hypothetical protein B7Z80_14160 [Rhodospirillales bacterium 20-64-7]|nr:MAG: hypothetical protein B7Z80_14160 [Rhodospirillales bacterium 20-64-7]HQT75785.1 tail fiber protein [Rhodopila sp.]